MENRAIVSLGSNTGREENIEQAVRMLSERFRTAVFSPAEYTEPVGCPSSAKFLNRVGVFRTSLSADELKSVFKEIETLLGRRPEDKGRGVVPVDIDLLRWNGQTLKPEDIKRGYILSGLRSLLATGEYDEWGGDEAGFPADGDQLVDRPAGK